MFGLGRAAVHLTGYQALPNTLAKIKRDSKHLLDPVSLCLSLDQLH